MDEKFIRLMCLELVARYGSDAGCADPTTKAQELYDWVMGTTDKASDDLLYEYGQPYGIPSKEDLRRSEKALMN